MDKRRVGRYVVYESFARGGMATVHLGRLVADRGFSRLVAVKMPSRSGGAAVSAMHSRALEEEARIASRIRHPNVVQPLDFLVDGKDLFIVMEYVHGVALSQLLDATLGEPIPPPIVVSILSDVLKGLHAAHEATDEQGRLLGVVHRDVSPHNVLVGVDGAARLADFGIAKVMRSVEHTETGFVKGKLGYMPPEQLRGLPLTRQADVFSAGAVLAECLSLIGPQAEYDEPTAWLKNAIEAISSSAVTRPLLEVIRVATASDARQRYESAAEMAAALTNAVAPARADDVAALATRLAGDVLDVRSELVRRVEADPLDDPPPEKREVVAADAPTIEASPSLSLSIRRSLPPIEPESITLSPVPSSRAPSAQVARGGWDPRGVVVFAAGAALVLAAGILWARRGRERPPEAHPIEVPSRAPVPAPAPSIDEPIELPSSAPPPPEPPRTPPKRPRRPPRVDCDPPFRTDAEGRRHYKPECL